jgi:hypothetical protein
MSDDRCLDCRRRGRTPPPRRPRLENTTPCGHESFHQQLVVAGQRAVHRRRVLLHRRAEASMSVNKKVTVPDGLGGRTLPRTPATDPEVPHRAVQPAARGQTSRRKAPVGDPPARLLIDALPREQRSGTITHRAARRTRSRHPAGVRGDVEALTRCSRRRRGQPIAGFLQHYLVTGVFGQESRRPRPVSGRGPTAALEPPFGSPTEVAEETQHPTPKTEPTTRSCCDLVALSAQRTLRRAPVPHAH